MEASGESERGLRGKGIWSEIIAHPWKQRGARPLTARIMPDIEGLAKPIMYRIEKTFHFSAAHQLTHLGAHSPEHKCARLHGHSYRVRVTLESEELDVDGFVLDYGLLEPVERYIDTVLDHRDLNEVLGIGSYTTAERISRALYERFKPEIPLLVAVAVSESPDTWAEYRQ